MEKRGLSVRSEPDGPVQVIQVFGELDLATADVLVAELERAEATDAAELLLDLSGLDFVDSTGLRVFVQAFERSEQDSKRLRMLRPTGQAQRILELTGIADRLPFID